MRISDRFDTTYSESNLQETYDTRVILSAAIGIDNINQRTFWRSRHDQIKIISRKVIAGTYHFTKYKLKLVSKGRGKIPREISIPTIRDRIALRAMCDFLSETYENTVSFQLPQEVVESVKDDFGSGNYDCFIKLDVADFFPSIKHDELECRLRRKIRDPRIIRFIASALETPTVTRASSSGAKSTVGIPQGLSISSILAAIYLLNVDRRYSNEPDIAYHRYVDDILILCKKGRTDDIVRNVKSRYRRIGLKIHDPFGDSEKSAIGRIGDPFGYLGYHFCGEKISVRELSIEKLKDSLAAIFAAYSHSKRKSTEFLRWRLNLRITGCIFQSKARGWLFFFSQINDESLLHSLDRYVVRLAERFEVEIKPKKFVRAYYQVIHHRYRSTYIPNFDKYDLPQMKNVLTEYFNMALGRLSDEEVTYQFRRKIDKQVRDLLTDIQDVGY